MPSKYIFCPHCQREVAQRTYRLHKCLYYDAASDTWDNGDAAECSPANTRMSDVHTPDTFMEHDALTDDDCELEFEDEVENTKVDPVQSFVTNKLEEIWETIELDDILNDISDNHNNFTNTPHDNFAGERDTVNLLSRWTILFLGSWSAAFNISMSAIGYFLIFLHSLLSVCGRYSPIICALSKTIPKSVYFLQKSQGQLKDNFEKYVMCTKCNAIYSLQSCLESEKKVLSCTFIEFPKHPQKKFRQKCDTALFKEIVLKDGKSHLYPIKSYCYRNIQESLKTLLDKRGFNDLCERWRNRQTIAGTYRDIYDGRVWKQFQSVSERPFFETARNYGLMLNIDWFQPYKHSPYSVGAIYLSLLNLPRDYRYRKENVIIVGIIPGPDEPKRSINSYLRPMVDELKELWGQGFKYKGVDDTQV